MNELCNISYKRETDYQGLYNTLNSLYIQINRPGIENKITKSIIGKYSSDKNVSKKVTLSDAQDKVSQGFIQDVNNIICSLTRKPLDQLSPKESSFRHAVLSAFFDINSIKEGSSPVAESEMATDEEQDIKKLQKLDKVVVDIYGTINVGLSNDLQDQFSKELRRLLVYDDLLKEKLELNNTEINQRIIQYKNKKFNNLVKYLKSIYTDDSKLTEYMYSNGHLDSSKYYYVLDLFKKHILQQKNRNQQLNKELEEKVLQKNRQAQEGAYKKLIAFVFATPELKTWFNNKFPNNYTNNEAQIQLFTGEDYSSYYEAVKKRVLKTHENQVKEIIEEIENPNNNLLNYVHDYISLSQFDDLLGIKLHEFVGINKNFLINVEPENQSSEKYIVGKSFKHKTAGWETSNKTDSDSHTSTGVKDILRSLKIYKYNEDHRLIPQQFDMSTLVQAYQALVTDIINNKLKLNNQEVEQKLKTLVNEISTNTVSNMVELFELLYKPYFIPNFRGRVIDAITHSDLFTNQHKNILYSLYTQVLDRSNPGSIISLEQQNINSDEKYSNKFLEITQDLIALVYRNVNNRYIESSTKSGKFGIKSTFNWDSDLFDLVERITFASKTRQLNKLVNNKYNYVSEINTVNSRISSSFIISDKEGNKYKIGFNYNQGSSNMEGLFSLLNNLTSIDQKTLDTLANVDLNTFKQKIINNTQNLNNEETLLKNLFDIFDDYLDLGLSTEVGLDTMILYKDKYTTEEYLFSKNYLNHFLKLALRVADVDFQVQIAENNGTNFKEFIKNDSKYASLYTREIKKTSSSIFDFAPDNVLFKVVSQQDLALSNFIKYRTQVQGKSYKSTTRTKQGTTVSNHSIARAGSELNRRLHAQRNNPVAQTLIFVQNPDIIDTDPIIDNEFTTPTGDIKSVQDLSTSELFYRAIIDKFYTSFLNTGKVTFQPTVYSDKTTFLNYLANTSIFGKDAMDLMVDNEEQFQNLYRTSFFSAHNFILNNVLDKWDKLITFSGETVEGVNRVVKVQNFLRSHSPKQIANLVFEYNKINELTPIELELDKDYRNKKTYCDLNEVLLYYSDLANNPERLAKYMQDQKNIFIEHLKEYKVEFNLFNSESELNSWINDSYKGKNYLTKLLSSEKLIKKSDRKQFAKDWIDKTTGDLIINKGNKLNPFLEKFFYIEGIYSNNLRLSLSGTEVNHPDKAFDTLFNRIKKALTGIDESMEKGPVIQNTARKNLNDLLVSEGITDFDEEAFRKIKYLSDLDGTPFQNIYDKTIIEIINTEQGTQFKRNVIIPATLQHPVPGQINGVAEQVRVCVIKDMEAPVNNLRSSDSIDSQDGSAQMSPIQVILENNSLGDQKVGTNRKPIWDDQTDDLTSFLAKFAAFGQTNAIMLQSLKSDSSQYNMFKKMHSIPWKGTIDLTKNINQFAETEYDQAEVTRWFKQAILENQKLFYLNKFGEKVEITNFGKDEHGYFTEEKIAGKTLEKVYHYFDDQSNHYTQLKEGLHNIDSLFELFVSLGGIHCVDADGNPSEFSNQVLTNFVINVGGKKTVSIMSAADVYQPLKDKFIGYAFNTSAVKNGAKNVNDSSYWKNDSPLSTFKVNVKGLGIQLDADHDVVDGELTEFSQVVAACAAYGKDFRAIEQIYLGLAESAFQASEKELSNIESFFKNYSQDPSKTKYALYTIVGKLIMEAKSNSDLDLTERIKQEVKTNFIENKDNSDLGLKLPFSDPSMYNQFITNITSVINKKSIKRKHPGSGYVMVPAYNVIQYFHLPEGNHYRKYMFKDILKKARNDYKGKLISELEKWCVANNIDPNKYGDRQRPIYKFNISTLLAETKDKGISTIYDGIISDDIVNYDKKLVETYLLNKQMQEPTRDKSWFMPTDIVQPITPTGDLGEPIDLSDMQSYYDFKNREELEGTTFKLCITKPNNLKPSFIRWQYDIDITTGKQATEETLPENVERRYMNIYDHPIIKNSWNKDKSKRPKQAEIQKVLDLLHQGQFVLNGETFNIVEGTLENTEAELVMGNMYKDLYGTGNNSLADILDKGTNFFKESDPVIQIPKGFYNMAFVKSNGKHVLISLGGIKETVNVYEDEFTNTYIDPNTYEIYTEKGGVKIGKYVESTYEPRDGKVFNGNLEVSENEYYLIQNDKGDVQKVLKKVEYLKRFKYNKTAIVNGQSQMQEYTIYQVAKVEDIKNSLNKKDDKELINQDAYYQISKILHDLYKRDSYVDIQINTSIELNPTIKRLMANSLVNFGRDTKLDENKKVVVLTPEEIAKLPKLEQHIISIRRALINSNFEEEYKNIKADWYDKMQLHKQKYASFLNSLRFISSRIPAQSLQSFMPMKCVGWTEDTSNTAYVSYIQTFLQGSDYDIDKAYIMGQSHNDNGIYVGWSSLFNYSSDEMLAISKTLPMPRKLKLKSVEDSRYNIDVYLDSIINSTGPNKLRNIVELVYKIDANNGKYNYSTDVNGSEKERIIKSIQKHQDYTVPYKWREQAFKNLASANIYNVVHNIRNRDQAYSPITMKDLQEEAGKSPKGVKTKKLNMINPLTKYIMQNQNLVGKGVIGIAANGEKDWFNLTYYYHDILRKEDDLFNIKMSHFYSRIQGRKDGVSKLTPHTVKYIPDLWNADKNLKEKIKKAFHQGETAVNTDDKYVDQLISQLLSAATDNAKELILAKINAGTNLAKYHLHLMMMGFKLADIVAFMTSPAIELIDQYASNNLYINKVGSIDTAVDIIKGKVNLAGLVVDVNSNYSDDPEAALELAEAEAELKQTLMEEGIRYRSTEYSWIIKELDVYKEVKASSLQDFFQKYILAKTGRSTKETKILEDYSLPVSSNYNTNKVFKYIDSIIDSINTQIQEYTVRTGDTYTAEDLIADINEFEKLTEQANETSTLASVWLKLNQGIPQTDKDLIKLIKKMTDTVKTRENVFKIKRIIEKENKLIDLTEEYKSNDEKKQELKEAPPTNKEKALAYFSGKTVDSNTSKYFKDLVEKLTDNNPEIASKVIAVLKDSIYADLFGNFDLYAYLRNDMVKVPQSPSIQYKTRKGDLVSYRELAANYYNIIKSSWNILDIVNRIPHYSKNLDLLNYTLQQRQLFSIKAKILDRLIPHIKGSISDKQYKLATEYADKIIITSYFLSNNDAIDVSKIDKVKIYNKDYELVNNNQLAINSLVGIDSLKHFVENEFFDWLQKNYPDNFLVKELTRSSNHGRSILRTKLNLADLEYSLLNKQTYNKYIIALQELSEDKIDSIYSITDILMLYNLAVNGTKLGGKYLTALFRDSITPGSQLYKYYEFIANQDYFDQDKYIIPTKRDFLMYIAPYASSIHELVNMKDPYVKILNPLRGFDIYKCYYDEDSGKWKYYKVPETLLDLQNLGLTKEVINARVHTYVNNSLMLFPELNRILRSKNIFKNKTSSNIAEWVSELENYIRQDRLMIYKNCT